MVCLLLSGIPFWPQQCFAGRLLFDGEDMLAYFKQHPLRRAKPVLSAGRDGALVMGEVSAWFAMNEGEVANVSFSPDDALNPSEPADPLQLDAGYEHLRALWQDWISAIHAIVPVDNQYNNLTHGINTETLRACGALGDGTPVPAALVNFYKVYNVEFDGVASVFSLSINHMDDDLVPFERLAIEWQAIQELQDDEFLDEDSPATVSGALNFRGYANPRWVPFTTGHNGDYLVFDPDPGPDGRQRQIVELVNESWTREVVAPSLETLIRDEVARLNTGDARRYAFILGQ